MAWIVLKLFIFANSDKIELNQTEHYRLTKNTLHLDSQLRQKLKLSILKRELACSNFGLFTLDTNKITFLPVVIIPEKNSFRGCRSFVWTDKKNEIHAFISTKNVLLNISQKDLLQMETSCFSEDGSFWFSGLDMTEIGQASIM